MEFRTNGNSKRAANNEYTNYDVSIEQVIQFQYLRRNNKSYQETRYEDNLKN